MENKIYDSEKIRKAAKRVRKLSGSIEETVKDTARGLYQEVDQLEGETARSMMDRFEEFERKARKLSNEMEDIGDDLYRYAKALEAVSKKLEALLQQ